MSKIINFLREIKTEFRHVNWPTKNQVTLYTIFVIAISVFIAYFLGLFDFIFGRGLSSIIF